MPVHSYFVLVAFTILLVTFILQAIRLSSLGLEVLGTPAIEKLPFYSGKVAVFTTWALFILKALGPRLGYIAMPAAASWFAVGLLYAGVFFLSVSFFNLGTALKVGLPSEETRLQTKGLYRLSRNPIYVGFHLIGVASCIYFPDLLNVTFTLYAMYIHHRIIREEENFLAGRFGREWLVYSTRVSRYL
jgi:protein-S-isoprenylcysteine O-methyltransferase Ste14